MGKTWKDLLNFGTQVESYTDVRQVNAEQKSQQDWEMIQHFRKNGITDPSDPDLLDYIAERRRKNYPGEEP